MKPTSYNLLPCFSLKVVREKSLRYPYTKVGDASVAVQVVRAFLQDKEGEHLIVLMLDNQHNFLGLTIAAQGGLTGMHVRCRDAMKAAIVARAHAIILAHNHPSSETLPSSDDIIFTNQVKKAGEILGVPLLDHIIVSSGINSGYYSFADHGMV